MGPLKVLGSSPLQGSCSGHALTKDLFPGYGSADPLRIIERIYSQFINTPQMSYSIGLTANQQKVFNIFEKSEQRYVFHRAIYQHKMHFTPQSINMPDLPKILPPNSHPGARFPGEDQTIMNSRNHTRIGACAPPSNLEAYPPTSRKSNFSLLQKFWKSSCKAINVPAWYGKVGVCWNAGSMEGVIAENSAGGRVCHEAQVLEMLQDGMRVARGMCAWFFLPILCTTRVRFKIGSPLLCPSGVCVDGHAVCFAVY